LRKYVDLLSLPVESYPTKEIFLDTKVLEKELYSRLDPSIREKLKNKGISIIQNIYTGYDSEYKAIDAKNNELLSVQLAVNTKTLLKLPNNKAYSITKLNTLTGEVYDVSYSIYLDAQLLEKEINKCIKRIRLLSNFQIIDDSVERIVKSLIKEGVRYIENDKEFIFTFERTPIDMWFKKVFNGEGYNFKDLVKISNRIAKPYLDKESERIFNLLKSIYDLNDDIKSIESKEVNKVDRVNLTELPTKIIDCEDLEDFDEKSVKNTKYRRTRKQSFTGGMVSVTFHKNNYFIAHLTNADLSILNDFEDIKPYLDIVNNSLITLKTPMLIDGVNIHIRDTMLLSPGGMKALGSIGNLYGIGKLNIDKKWLSRMDDF
jgi:hypothetical protein